MSAGAETEDHVAGKSAPSHADSEDGLVVRLERLSEVHDGRHDGLGVTGSVGEEESVELGRANA